MNIFNNNILIICGHYGVGKTNIAVNFAIDMKKDKRFENKYVSLIDFDIVNPYYRSSDNKKETELNNIELISPLFANSNVDIPGVVPDVLKAFVPGNAAVFDVGGDDSGAFALGGLSDKFISSGYDLYCVINMYRPSIVNVDDAVKMIEEIEISSKLKVTGIINNSNLGDETTKQIILDSMDYAKKVSVSAGLPIVCTTVNEIVFNEFSEKEKEELGLIMITNVTKKPF